MFEINKNNIIQGPRKRQRINIISKAKWKHLRRQFIKQIKTIAPPKNFFQIKYREDKNDWIAAYNKEINNLEQVGEMTVTALPPNKKPIKILELFSVKFDNPKQKIM